MTRRQLLTVLLAALGAGATGEALAGPRRRAARRTRRRVRRRVRRRHRRRVTWRVVGDRRRLVVPVALAVGWELAVDDRVVVVHEVKTVEGAEVVVVKNADGSTEEIEIDREDTAENSVAQQSSVLPDSDTKTPAVETEEEVEEEVEE
jgi:bifunctional DNA-binding transcriptional regulator/antitoxin component of YhaV-PrlF toxin-antitoxin module